MRIVVSGVVATVLGSALLVAQTPPAKPGPEHKRLERMVGQWTYQGEAKAEIEGKTMKFRATVTEDSPTASTFKLEAGPADGQMMVIEEGKSTKQK